MQAITIARPTAITQDEDIASLVNEWKLQLRLQVASGEIADSTRVTYERGMDKFMSWLQAQDVYQIDSDDIRRWLAEMRATSKVDTANTHYHGVRHFFAWAVGKRRLFYDPTTGVKGAKRIASRAHKRDILSDAEVRAVLAQPDTATAAGKRDAAILYLKAFTGVRDVELHRADLSDLRVINGSLLLYIRGKGRQESDEYVVVDNPQAQDAIHAWLSVRGGLPGALFLSLSRRNSKGSLEDRRLSLRSIRELIIGYYQAAGVYNPDGRKSSHSLRHTAITSAFVHGASVPQVKVMARHKSEDTTMGYYHAIDRLQNPGERFIRYDD